MKKLALHIETVRNLSVDVTPSDDAGTNAYTSSTGSQRCC